MSINLGDDIETIEIDANQVQAILDTWERTDVERPCGQEDVLNHIWTWPHACTDGRLAAMASIRSSAGAGPTWAIYLAYVEETNPHALIRAAGLVGATMRRTCDWSINAWVKLNPSDENPEQVVEHYLARLGVGENLGDNQRITAYRSGSGMTIAVRDITQYPEAINCEAPEWFGGNA